MYSIQHGHECRRQLVKCINSYASYVMQARFPLAEFCLRKAITRGKKLERFLIFRGERFR